MVHQEVIIRIVSSSQVIGSDLLFISAIQTDLGIKKGLRFARKPFAVFIVSTKLCRLLRLIKQQPVRNNGIIHISRFFIKL